jgi:hypothetical protein
LSFAARMKTGPFGKGTLSDLYLFLTLDTVQLVADYRLF